MAPKFQKGPDLKRFMVCATADDGAHTLAWPGVVATVEFHSRSCQNVVTLCLFALLTALLTYVLVPG
jgi:hypothetical protein